VCADAGDKDADNRGGAVCVLLASPANLQPVVRDLPADQLVSFYSSLIGVVLL